MDKYSFPDTSLRCFQKIDVDNHNPCKDQRGQLYNSQKAEGSRGGSIDKMSYLRCDKRKVETTVQIVPEPPTFRPTFARSRVSRLSNFSPPTPSIHSSAPPPSSPPLHLYSLTSIQMPANDLISSSIRVAKILPLLGIGNTTLQLITSYERSVTITDTCSQSIKSRRLFALIH